MHIPTSIYNFGVISGALTDFWKSVTLGQALLIQSIPFILRWGHRKWGGTGELLTRAGEASLLNQPDLYYKGTGRKINSSEGILCGLYKWSIQKGCSPGAFYLKICKRMIWIAKPATPFSISMPSSQVVSLPERRGRILTVLLWETSPTACTSPSSPLVLQSHQPFPPSRGCPFPIEAGTGLLGCLKPLNTVCHSLRVSAVWKLSFLSLLVFSHRARAVLT